MASEHSCPHGRPGWQMCCWCLGLNNDIDTRQPVAMNAPMLSPRPLGEIWTEVQDGT